MILRGPIASAADVARFQAEAQLVAGLDASAYRPALRSRRIRRPAVFQHAVHRRQHAGPASGRWPAAAARSRRHSGPVCRAIHFAHQRGILHRDLKPSNILLDADGRPHVTDFGLAKRLDRRRHADALRRHRRHAVATWPPSKPPASAASIGPTSDVYSLGTILYQMLTGRPPFQAASPVDTVLLVLEQEPLPPRADQRRAPIAIWK